MRLKCIPFMIKHVSPSLTHGLLYLRAFPVNVLLPPLFPMGIYNQAFIIHTLKSFRSMFVLICLKSNWNATGIKTGRLT